MSQGERPIGVTFLAVAYFILGLVLLAQPFMNLAAWDADKIEIARFSFSVSATKAICGFLALALFFIAYFIWNLRIEVLYVLLPALLASIALELYSHHYLYCFIDFLQILYIFVVRDRFS